MHIGVGMCIKELYIDTAFALFLSLPTSYSVLDYHPGSILHQESANKCILPSLDN
jgi:hypothetical protein